MQDAVIIFFKHCIKKIESNYEYYLDVFKENIFASLKCVDDFFKGLFNLKCNRFHTVVFLWHSYDCFLCFCWKHATQY